MMFIALGLNEMASSAGAPCFERAPVRNIFRSYGAYEISWREEL